MAAESRLDTAIGQNEPIIISHPLSWSKAGTGGQVRSPRQIFESETTPHVQLVTMKPIFQADCNVDLLSPEYEVRAPGGSISQKADTERCLQRQGFV